MMRPIRWVVFDLGGVVIDVHFNNFFSEIPQEYHQVITAQQQSLTAIFREYEARSGEQLPASVFENIRKHLDVPISDQHLIHAINSMLGAQVQPVCETIGRLARSYSVACLSNTNHIHWEHLLKNYPIMEKFKIQLASHIIGAAKPDPKIYRLAEVTLSARPSEILFFDDKPENIESARTCGWNAEVFTNYESFLGFCREYSLLL